MSFSSFCFFISRFIYLSLIVFFYLPLFPPISFSPLPMYRVGDLYGSCYWKKLFRHGKEDAFAMTVVIILAYSPAFHNHLTHHPTQISTHTNNRLLSYRMMRKYLYAVCA